MKLINYYYYIGVHRVDGVHGNVQMKNEHLVMTTARATNFGAGKPKIHSWPQSQMWNCYGNYFARHTSSAFHLDPPPASSIKSDPLSIILCTVIESVAAAGPPVDHLNALRRFQH
jgi:hypothetical protein